MISIIENMPFLAVAALICVAVYIMMTQRNLIKIVMGVTHSRARSTSSSWRSATGRAGSRRSSPAAPWSSWYLPVPQALTLTSIVIGVSTTALMLSLIVLIYRHTGETDAEKSRRVKG